MKRQARVIVDATRRATNGAARAMKPAVRGTCRWLGQHPEAVIGAGSGYCLGKVVDRTPVLGRLTGGNARWILGGAGLLYGYNKALLRRTLHQSRAIIDRSLYKHVDGEAQWVC